LGSWLRHSGLWQASRRCPFIRDRTGPPRLAVVPYSHFPGPSASSATIALAMTARLLIRLVQPLLALLLLAGAPAGKLPAPDGKLLRGLESSAKAGRRRALSMLTH
jgi:hypothetical protein